MLRSLDIRLCEYIGVVIYLSRRIYEAHRNRRKPGRSRRAGERSSRRWPTRPGCASWRCWGTTRSASATSTTASDCRSRPCHATSRICARAGWLTTRRDGVWMHYQVSRSLESAGPRRRRGAVDALAAGAGHRQDRKQFQRSFGQLYVLDSPAAGRAVRRGRRSRSHDRIRPSRDGDPFSRRLGPHLVRAHGTAMFGLAAESSAPACAGRGRRVRHHGGAAVRRKRGDRAAREHASRRAPRWSR